MLSVVAMFNRLLLASFNRRSATSEFISHEKPALKRRPKIIPSLRDEERLLTKRVYCILLHPKIKLSLRDEERLHSNAQYLCNDKALSCRPRSRVGFE